MTRQKFPKQRSDKRRDFITKSLSAGVVAGMGFSLLPQEAKANSIENEVKQTKHKCKITVLRRELYEELQEEYLAYLKAGKCDFFKDGQEILVDESSYWRMLDGKMCAYA
jgi:hypothetical protein